MPMYDFNTPLDRNAWSEKWMYDSVVDGHKVIPMAVADTDLVSPIEVREAIKNISERCEFGYPGYRPDFKSVIASWQERYYGWRPREEDIFETPGLLMTMGAFIRNMTNPGDKVILSTPVYHSFARTIRENHRGVTECNMICGENNHYTMDFDHFDACCRKKENKIAILCSPHNPVGRCWTEDELVTFVDIAQRNGVIVICDEIHADFVWGDRVFTPILNVAKNSEGIIVFSSGGKLFNIGGIFSSYVFTADPLFKQQLDIIIHELHWQATAFAHEAAYAGYKYGHTYRLEVLAHIRKMQEKFCAGVNAMPYPIKAPLPEATYLLWGDFRDTGWDADTIHTFLVQEAGLGFNRGDQFGAAGACFARINCGVPEVRIDEALSHIETAFKKKFR